MSSRYWDDDEQYEPPEERSIFSSEPDLYISYVDPAGVLRPLRRVLPLSEGRVNPLQGSSNYMDMMREGRVGEPYFDENSDDTYDYYGSRGRGRLLGTYWMSKYLVEKQLKLAKPLGSGDRVGGPRRGNIPFDEGNDEATTDAVRPRASVQPDGSVRSRISVQPDGSIKPLASVQPDGSVRPRTSVQPDKSVKPQASARDDSPPTEQKTDDTSAGGQGNADIEKFLKLLYVGDKK